MVHVWAAPDPDEFEAGIDADAMVCSRGEPWAEQRGIRVVFHPWNHVDVASWNYTCLVCGKSTNWHERTKVH